MPTHTDVIWCSLLTLVYIFAPALALHSTLQKMHVTFTQCLLFRLGNFDFIYSPLLMVSYFCDPHFLIALCFLTICLPRSLSSVSFSPSFTSLPALFWRLVSHVGLLLLPSFLLDLHIERSGYNLHLLTSFYCISCMLKLCINMYRILYPYSSETYFFLLPDFWSENSTDVFN